MREKTVTDDCNPIFIILTYSPTLGPIPSCLPKEEGLDSHWTVNVESYHSNLGPFTLAPNLFPGTTEGAGRDLHKPKWFLTKIPEGISILS